MAKSPKSVARRARHKKWLKRAKGFRGRRKNVYKIAKEAVLKAGQHAFFDRRKKKGTFRQLWQLRINAAARAHGISYSRLMAALKTEKSQLNRKVLSEIAADHPAIFQAIVEKVSKR